MDHCKNNNQLVSDDLTRITYSQYALPTHDDDYDDSDSSKSTPYYTPMEFLQSSFEFPSPTLEKHSDFGAGFTSNNIGYETPSAMPYPTNDAAARKPSTPKTFATTTPKQMQSTSPALHRKLRRFSLYERRSCSPQHLLLRNSSTEQTVPDEAVDVDKENTKPRLRLPTTSAVADSMQLLTQSGNNSPIAIYEESHQSPKLLASESRLSYSPKQLLSSLNNLNVGGSPLGVISSAGYKNGNYFKFPEVDRNVYSADTAPSDDNHLRSRHRNRLGNTSPALAAAHHKVRLKPEAEVAKLTARLEESPDKTTEQANAAVAKADGRKTRKNKNNLTIEISHSSADLPPITPCSTPKPKTPTIKSTKEKALSLDSAATVPALTVAATDTRMSCDELDARESQLSLISDEHMRPALLAGVAESFQIAAKTQRRKQLTASSSEWLQYHRKQHHFQLHPELPKTSTSSEATPKDDTSDAKPPYQQHIQSASNNVTPLRGLHKHNPLLHASNTNLKTLPEFLTLVEFTPHDVAATSAAYYPFKQKSFDLPSAHTPSSTRTKSITSNAATNLLQRRGSNHSLTLNLHGSCSNLLGSCRSGLSVSNYSLGSAANSTSNLAANAQTTLSAVHATQPTTQCVKQSLFRRRGSNNSLTLHPLNATSCGNLNAYSSQSCLNAEAGVTRTCSFIAPTHSVTVTAPKRGLLERRGSNQSLTLQMGGSNTGTVTDAIVAPAKPLHSCKNVLPVVCTQPHQRKFFSSENLTKANTQFADLNQAHKRNAQQVCFGSVSDLQSSARDLQQSTEVVTGSSGSVSRVGQLDFQDSTVCTCSGVRNITTRPLSPQTTSEEFKVYLANIQLLQNASNVLNQHDLIKLNYIFDHSYAPSHNQSCAESAIAAPLELGGRSAPATALMSTSEDCEVDARYQRVVVASLAEVQLADEEQKRMFRALHKEFWELPLNHQEKPMVFGSQHKNRYKTILPNENSRVLLDSEWQQLLAAQTHKGGELWAESTKQLTEAPYINANYIKGPDFTTKCYIATQGPLPNSIFDFWLMVFQNTNTHLDALSKASSSNANNCFPQQQQQYDQKIVMLTNFMENTRQKCSVYFPLELNEIFVAAEQQESHAGTSELATYFDEFLATSQPSHNEADHFCGNGIQLISRELPDSMRALLPRSSNYFVLKNIGIVKKNGYSIRKFSALFCSHTAQQLLMRKFYCYHYWYPDWPDHRSPKDINTLLDICLHILNVGKCEQEFACFVSDETPSPQRPQKAAQHVDQYQQDVFNEVQPLPVIHCSAGIGRTGCLAAILNSVRQLRTSLAYSLVTLAGSTCSAHENQVRSALDFRLPQVWWNRADGADIAGHSDTDSSFTQNTLLYANYLISQTQQVKRTEVQEQEAQELEAQEQEESSIESAQQTPPENLFEYSRVCSMDALPKLPDIYVDILGIVCNLRLQRGGMVQNSEQYELIHRAICLYLKRTFALKRF